MTPKEAKRLVNEWLHKNGCAGEAVRARTVSFSDLARDSCVFVTVQGWQANPLGESLINLGIRHGFRIHLAGF